MFIFLLIFVEGNLSRTESLLSRVLDKRSVLSSTEQRILLAEILIKYGADVNFCREGDNSPLITAVQFQSNELVDILLKKGSHVNHPGRDMATPLHFCCMSKRGIEINYCMLNARTYFREHMCLSGCVGGGGACVRKRERPLVENINPPH